MIAKKGPGEPDPLSLCSITIPTHLRCTAEDSNPSRHPDKSGQRTRTATQGADYSTNLSTVNAL